MAVRKRQVSVVGLCEDARHRQFITAYFVAKGFEPRKLDIRIAPPGVGSAEQYVRENYEPELTGFRRYCTMNSSSTCAFVAMIDADTETVQSHFDDLDAQLRNADTPRPIRGRDEPVAILVPKHHIETWAYHILDEGQAVSESQQYKRQISSPGQLQRAGRNLADLADCERCPPSLSRAREELARLPGCA